MPKKTSSHLEVRFSRMSQKIEAASFAMRYFGFEIHVRWTTKVSDFLGRGCN